MSKPPLVPPSNSALESVISPDDFNNKPLELIWVSLSVTPPITPPEKSTCDPVISPVDLSIKLFAVSLIDVAANSKPPILPPVKRTAEPVMSPVDFTLNGALPLASSDVAPAKNLVSPIDDSPDTLVSVVLWIAFDPITQSAINPALAVKTPSIIAPLAINFPLEDTAKSEPNLT